MEKHSKRRKHIFNFVIVILILVLAFTVYENYKLLRNVFFPKQNLAVHFIDVGQADCIFIDTKKGTVLIDGGESATANKVVDYLKAFSVKSIDYLIATHPHSDHIGGLPQIIREFKIGKVLMPDAVNTTVTFERFLDAMEEGNIVPDVPMPGEEFSLGDVKLLIIAPNSDEYDNLNDYSIGVKISYGHTSFLFAGDAEADSETEMVSSTLDITADVFKANHHGSRTSNSNNFLNSVNPRYCVISCGKNNDYGHPHSEVMERLDELGINVLRTDMLGTIVIESDGKELRVQTERDGEI